MSNSDAGRRAVLPTGAVLERTVSGRFRLLQVDGTVHDPVHMVRAFPVSSPDIGFSLMSAEGHELLWIERLDSLAGEVRELIEQALDEREFMPVILRLASVSGYVTPCTWRVDTDRGEASFVLKGEEDIRRMGNGALLITDSDGIHYLLRDVSALDRISRRILDRFL